MRSLFSWLRQGAAALVVGLSLFGLATGPSLALVLPPSFAPQEFPTQQTHYLRFTVNWNSCQLPASAGSCSFKVGALPYNALILRVTSIVPVAFGSTTNPITIGTTSTSGNEIVSTAIAGATAVTTPTAAAVAAALNATGNGATQTGTNGGFDVWVKQAYTGTAPTTGTAIIVIEYAAPNDGSCTQVPMNATAGPC